MKINYCLAFDVDRPRGEWLHRAGGAALLEKKLAFAAKATAMLDERAIKRTLFICGHFLEGAVLHCSHEMIAQSLGANELTEIGNHTFSHSLLQPLASRTVTDAVITPSILNVELRQTADCIASVIKPSSVGRFMKGIRTPYGYSATILADAAYKHVLIQSGYNYISSMLRAADGGLYAPITSSDLRQPFTIDNAITEIPTHGWQDSAFTTSSSTISSSCPPIGTVQIMEYYETEFAHVQNILAAKQLDSFTYVFTLHFFDMMEYDPDLLVWKHLLDEVLPKYGGQSLFYSDICGDNVSSSNK